MMSDEILEAFEQLKKEVEQLRKEVSDLQKLKLVKWSERMDTKKAILYINIHHGIVCKRNKFDELWKVHNYFPVRKYDGDKNRNYFHRSEIDQHFDNIKLLTWREAQAVSTY